VLRIDLAFTVKRRVLVIEDDPDGRRLIVDALVERGIDVIAAVDGLHALRTALAVSPSVVVLDLALPEMDGATFIEQWRDRYPQARGVPVVVVSGKSDAREIGARIGASRVFKKPFIVADLVTEVSRVLH
jgi:DNA-binding response OmpR family regulator